MEAKTAVREARTGWEVAEEENRAYDVFSAGGQRRGEPRRTDLGHVLEGGPCGL